MSRCGRAIRWGRRIVSLGLMMGAKWCLGRRLVGSGRGGCIGASGVSLFISPYFSARKLTCDVCFRIVPLAIVAIVFSVLFEVYKSDFEKWVKPLTDWLREREKWSWVIPTAILFVLSFPPLFGHEIVQLIVGVSLHLR